MTDRLQQWRECIQAQDLAELRRKSARFRSRIAAIALFASAGAVVPVSLVVMSWDGWWWVLGIAEAVLPPAVPIYFLVRAGLRAWRRGF